MPADLFRRFKQGGAPRPAADGDGSGSAFRNQGRSRVMVHESEFLAEVDRIPAMPVVVMRLLKEVGNQHVSNSGLEDLIKQDMVIAGRLLKLVNSPFYGLSNPVASITMAVAIIGQASLRSLVLAASTTNLMSLDLSCYGFTEGGLWKNSVTTAAVTRGIAKRAGADRDTSEEWFVAGLLRDVGMLVVAPFLTRNGLDMRREAEGNTDILRRERALLGFDHCWAGEQVAGRWGLPADLAVAIGKHHRIPTDASPNAMRQLAAVRLAERLVYAAGVGVVADHPFETHVDGVLLHACGLDGAGFASLMQEVPGIIAEAENILKG